MHCLVPPKVRESVLCRTLRHAVMTMSEIDAVKPQPGEVGMVMNYGTQLGLEL
jgi:hypothetical protein